MSYPYHPFYCEENAYALLDQSPIDTMDPHLLFISNEQRQILMFQQGAGAEPLGVVIWDYHVVVLTLATMEVWDQDTIAGFPLPLAEYLELSFGPDDLLRDDGGTTASMNSFPSSWRPQFRLVSKAAAKSHFSTDRSHMLDDLGQYLKPPPPWDPPQNGPPSLQSILDVSLVDLAHPHLGPWLDRQGLLNLLT